MHGNTGGGVVIDVAAADAIDWAAVDQLAPRLGPRSQGLIACRNEVGLRVWVCRMAPPNEDLHPAVSSAYRELADLLGLTSRRPS